MALVRRHPLSLAARSTLATSLALVAFLGLTGLALDRAYFEGARSSLQDRLQGYVYAYLAGTEVTRGGKVLLPDTMPHSDFLRPGSGLYASIDGDKGFHWESPSAIGRDLPVQRHLQPGQSTFQGPLDTDVGRVYVYSQGVVYDTPTNTAVKLTFSVAQSEVEFRRQLAAYRHTLFAWLAGLGLMLVLLQLLLLRWSLSPLRRVSTDMTRVQRGEHQRLSGEYPSELTSLTDSLNAFIESERDHLARYRNTLDDLAHSLKTPLAVLRSRLETDESQHDPEAQELAIQVRRMDEIVAYQLSRAAMGGHRTFAVPIRVAGDAEDLVQGLEKVYAAKNVLCEFDIEPLANFYGERGDLLELLGNLLENAFKWARHRVLLSVHPLPMGANQRIGLEIVVEDDGPGIAEDQIMRVLQRGVRGDERVQGHGIGLAIVQEIIKAYRAELDVEHSTDLGGARFRVRFTQN